MRGRLFVMSSRKIQMLKGILVSTKKKGAMIYVDFEYERRKLSKVHPSR